MTKTADIVPDGFDLSKARNKRTTTPDEEQPRCPECGTTNISPKVGNHIGSGKQRKPGDWRCNRHGCNHHFEEPRRGDGDE